MFVPRRVLSSLFLPLFVAGVAIVEAQTFRGGISGRVVDDSGGVLPGVSVTATTRSPPAWRARRRLRIPAISRFLICRSVTYDVEAIAPGIPGAKRHHRGHRVARHRRIEFKLGVSAVAETVQVSAAALTLDTVSTALSNVISPSRCRISRSTAATSPACCSSRLAPPATRSTASARAATTSRSMAPTTTTRSRTSPR